MVIASRQSSDSNSPSGKFEYALHAGAESMKGWRQNSDGRWEKA